MHPTSSVPSPGRVACPRCGHTGTLGDLAREAQALRGRAGLTPEPPGPQAPASPHHDVCVACGTLYYPWVHREALRRRVEVERLRARVGLAG